MKKVFVRLLPVIMVLLMVFSIVACKGDVAEEGSTPGSKTKEITTEYYMPKGWDVETPTWSAPDEGAITTIPSTVLSGNGEKKLTNVTQELKDALAYAVAHQDEYFKPAKNVIIIISDGMGISHVKASEQWSGELIMTQLPNIGVSKTKTREDERTDSGAGGTAIATGYKTTYLFLSMDAEGNDLKSVSELAREKGKLVGVVTNAEMADATPACFSVHNKNRSQGWTKIMQQQVVFGPDLFMGNGYSDFSTYFKKSSPLKKFVDSNKIKRYWQAADMVSHFNEEDGSKMWALSSAYANEFARHDTINESGNLPTLQQMTQYAIAWLDAHDKEDEGFVVMIENTYTDYFGHGNRPYDGSSNTYGIVKEVQSTDEAVAIALKYVLEHPDTALIVTADHETGDMYLPSDTWKTNFSTIIASSGNHSVQNVPVFAIGKGTEALNSLSPEDRAAGKKWYEATPYENAKIGQVIGALLGDNEFGGDVNTDVSSKRSPLIKITTTKKTKTLTFTLDLMGVPIFAENLIQFKIKPQSANDRVSVFVDTTEEFSEAKFSTAVTDGTASTVLADAYRQAFVSSSGKATGWYQFSFPASVKGSAITITLTSASEEGFAEGTELWLDDLTIQYASTIGWLKFSSDNAEATTEAGDPLLKYYTED